MNGSSNSSTTAHSASSSSTFASRFTAIPSRIMAHRDKARKVVETLSKNRRENEERAFKAISTTATEDVELLVTFFTKSSQK